jgi:hypothetical protein
MASSRLTLKISISGLKETLAKFSELPKDASAELRVASLKISQEVAAKVRTAAGAQGSQAGLLVRTVKANKDRVPSVSAGGSTRLGSHKKPAYKLLFGSEFGAKFLHQFKPRNTAGYWFYPTVTAAMPEMEEQWNRAADAIVAKFSEGTVTEETL